MFILFMTTGISKPNGYHLQCGLISITMITGYIIWWYLYDYVETSSHSFDPIIDAVIYINVALTLIYYVVYFRFVAPYCHKKKKKSHRHSSNRSHSSRSKDDSHSRPLSPRSTQSSPSSSSTSSSSSKPRKRSRKAQKYEQLRSSKLYRKCVPILLLDTEICTIYLAACIYEYLFEKYSHNMQYIPIILCSS